jgi:hypothetical protein
MEESQGKRQVATVDVSGQLGAVLRWIWQEVRENHRF